ncbi:hypothetical protein HNV08_12565 [Winogradskyella eckloniae]|uniref:hypothetical protein n=1 Tax=Winogradskyella eckloniae TaxID=1089306 RepID=UPI001563E834|nr:hypothetical protein [Winogradskyella eckloniae]NRD20881.1 hypothetical protein [Winogradskyella eckloniae]
MKKNITLALALFFTLVSFSQQSFFKALEAHGEEAIYQRYYSVYKDDGGKQVIKGKQYQFKVEILKTQGVYSGVKLVGATKDDKSSYTIDATKSKSSKIIGYPNVSHLVDKISRKGLVVVGDYIFKVGNVWKESDGYGFNNIDEIYIRVGADVTDESEADGKKKKKKKKFGAFMGKLKDAAINKAPAECASPACKKAESMDLNKYVLDYLETMKAKQDAYTLTAKDKADIALIENAVNGYYDHVNKTNDAYWKSAEGQAILENRRRAEGYAAKNEVTLKNNTGRTIYIATKGSRNQGTELSSGASTSWNCETDAYFQTKNTKNTSTNYYETTSRKAYTANSNCGGTKLIN